MTAPPTRVGDRGGAGDRAAGPSGGREDAAALRRVALTPRALRSAWFSETEGWHHKETELPERPGPEPGREGRGLPETADRGAAAPHRRAVQGARPPCPSPLRGRSPGARPGLPPGPARALRFAPSGPARPPRQPRAGRRRGAHTSALFGPCGRWQGPIQGPCPGELLVSPAPPSAVLTGLWLLLCALGHPAPGWAPVSVHVVMPVSKRAHGPGFWGLGCELIFPGAPSASHVLPRPSSAASARRPVTQLRALSASSLGSDRLHGQSSSEQAASALCALGTQRALSVAGVAQGMYGGGWLQGHGHPELLQVLGALGGIGSGREQGWGAGGGGGPPGSNRELERLGPGGSGLPGARSVLSRLQLLLSPQTLETAGYVKSVLVSAPGRPGRWFLPVRHSRPPCTLGGFCDCCAASQRLCLVAEEAHTEARDMANAPVGFWRCPRELPLWSLFRAGSPLPGPSPHGFSTPSMDPGLSLAGSPWSHSCSPAPWRNQLIGLLTCGRGLSTVPMPSCRHICSERARGGLALHPPRLSISVCTAPPCPGSSSRLRRKLQHRELRATQRAERCPIQPSANRPEQTLRQCLWTVGPSQGHL